MPRLAVGARVFSFKETPQRYGNITKSIGKQRWMVRYDNEAQDVEATSRSIKLVFIESGLSPASKARVVGESKGEGDDVDDESSSDKDGSESSSDEEQQTDATRVEGTNVHATRSAAFDAKMAKLYGTTIEAKNGTLTTTWKIVQTTGEVDCFPELSGPMGSKRKATTQHDICPEFAFRNDEGDKLRLLKYLWPVDFNAGFEKVRAAHHAKFPKRTAISMREWVTFNGMLLGATQFTQRGRALWRDTSSSLRGKPDYGQHLGEHRFESIKNVANYCFADSTKSASDPWWPIRGGVDGFNENRKRTIKRTRAICIDESMSAYQPRSTKLGGLPHLSFIKRKPRPLGTEFKSAADGVTGVMLWLEIQEGKSGMKSKAFVGSLGANAACALRIALGVIGAGV